MKFNAESIQLEHDDNWFLHGFDQEVSYDLLTELYWQTAEHCEEAIAEEFERLAEAERDGANLKDALRDPMVPNPYSTYLAGKLVSLNSVLCHHVKYADSLD